MPSRILREGIIESEAINLLSPCAELFYRRLMSVVDDWGRYYARPAVLRGKCYPLQVDKVSEDSIRQWLDECVVRGLITIDSGGKHLQITNFNQQRRGPTKYPEAFFGEPESAPAITPQLFEAELLKNDLAIAKKIISDSASAPYTNTHTHTKRRVFGEVQFPKSLDVPEFKEAWKEWTTHLKQKRSNTTDSAFNKQIKLCEQLGLKDAILSINASIMSNWQGLFPPKKQSGYLEIVKPKPFFICPIKTPGGLIQKQWTKESPPKLSDFQICGEDAETHYRSTLAAFKAWLSRQQ